MVEEEEEARIAGNGQEPRDAALAVQPHQEKELYRLKDIASPRTKRLRTL